MREGMRGRTSMSPIPVMMLMMLMEGNEGESITVGLQLELTESDVILMGNKSISDEEQNVKMLFSVLKQHSWGGKI